MFDEVIIPYYLDQLDPICQSSLSADRGRMIPGLTGNVALLSD
jgi:hypothetical protein